MRITTDLIKAVFPGNANALKFVDAINDVCDKYGINTPARQAAFIAQIAHESGNFRYVREIWGPTAAQTGYEGRTDLGNTRAGDGKRYMGRGLIQITGRANYTSLAKDLQIDCMNHPELLEQPEYASMSAGWFWDKRKLNSLADAGAFELITKRINGGLNGYTDREAIWQRLKLQMGC